MTPTPLHELVPEWCALIDNVRDGVLDLDVVIVTIDAFVGDPDLLERALLYAYDAGVTVTFAPGPKP